MNLKLGHIFIYQYIFLLNYPYHGFEAYLKLSFGTCLAPVIYELCKIEFTSLM